MWFLSSRIMIWLVSESWSWLRSTRGSTIQPHENSPQPIPIKTVRRPMYKKLRKLSPSTIKTDEHWKMSKFFARILVLLSKHLYPNLGSNTNRSYIRTHTQRTQQQRSVFTYPRIRYTWCLVKIRGNTTIQDVGLCLIEPGLPKLPRSSSLWGPYFTLKANDIKSYYDW